jgi:hypothetical protein
MDKFTKRDGSGSVDVAASADAYAAALTKWVSENELPVDSIANAVNTVLDRYAGQRISMPALLSMAAQELGATPETFKVLSNRVHSYVKGQTTAERLFVIKGSGGGVSRERPAKKSA